MLDVNGGHLSLSGGNISFAAERWSQQVPQVAAVPFDLIGHCPSPFVTVMVRPGGHCEGCPHTSKRLKLLVSESQPAVIHSSASADSVPQAVNVTASSHPQVT